LTSAASRLGWPLKYAIVLIAGCAHALGVTWPFGIVFTAGQPLWWLQILSLTVLVWQLDQARTKREAAWLGLLFAAAMQLATWWWLFISLHTYGGLAAPLAVIAIVGLATFLALYYAAACALFVALAPVNQAGRALVFAAVWLLAELTRVALFTGFPWGQGGYAQLDGPFVDLSKLVGVHGLTFGAALLASGLAGLLAKPRWVSAGAIAGSVLAAVAGSAALSVGASGVSLFSQVHPVPLGRSDAPFTVTLLQGNIAQDEKFKPTGGLPDALSWYGMQLLVATSTLVITPETALPLLPQQLPEGYLEALVKRFSQQPGSKATAALIGIPLGDSQLGYTNSVIALKPTTSLSAGTQAIYQYDKHHLVPFGEFVHPLFKWFLTIVNIPLSDFNRGDVSQPSFEWQGQRIAPNICYEDLFGEELAARFIDPANAPTMMVNVSNIGWFGNTVAIDQHLNISRMRAIEFERPMIRATNTGATAIIDHTGRVTHSLERHTRGVLVAAVEGRSGNTPYAWLAARFGLWPWWLLIFAIISGAVSARYYCGSARNS
jgi:apolipoprotein N-acyltransferase